MSRFNVVTYNFVAARIRERFSEYADFHGKSVEPLRRVVRGELAQLSLHFATHFASDNVNFDPLKFLDQCSADKDRFPLSELWEGYIERG